AVSAYFLFLHVTSPSVFYSLSLHDALPIFFVGFDLMRPAVTSYLSKVAGNEQGFVSGMNSTFTSLGNVFGPIVGGFLFDIKHIRSEEHASELQSRFDLVCRLLLEKKNVYLY